MFSSIFFFSYLLPTFLYTHVCCILYCCFSAHFFVFVFVLFLFFWFLSIVYNKKVKCKHLFTQILSDVLYIIGLKMTFWDLFMLVGPLLFVLVVVYWTTSFDYCLLNSLCPVLSYLV